jgi:CubicO group peptidase (beta-lactamase class C family)
MNGRPTHELAVGFASLDDYIRRQMERLRIPGIALAVVEGDRITHMRGFGRAHPDGDPPTARTPFFIASLTKSFTALAVMQLVEAGQIELDAPVQRYLPRFCVADPASSARMTVRHLLNQSSGLPSWAGEIPEADFGDSPGTTERQARELSTFMPSRFPGDEFEYSNVNYNLLGLIIEAAAGETYADYIQGHIFTPLGMGHSFTSPAAARQNGLATGHQFLFTVPFAAPDIPVSQGWLASGGLASCAEDIARYLIAHLNGGRCGDAQILSAAGIDELTCGTVAIGLAGLGPIVRLLAGDIDLGQYGMGWFVDAIGDTKIVWHGGTFPHFGSYMALLPEQKKGIVLLFNACHHWLNPVLAEFGTGAAAILAGQPPPPKKMSGVIPLMLRSQLLIPAFLIVDVIRTFQTQVHARQHPPPTRRPGWAAWVPLILNLLVALTLVPVSGRRRGYLQLYMPDFTLIANLCGRFALLWSVLRIAMWIRAMWFRAGRKIDRKRQ